MSFSLRGPHGILFGTSQKVELKCTSWNCTGSKKTKKIKQVMNTLKDTNSKHFFLQETHTLKEDNVRIRRWQGSVYAASFTTHKYDIDNFFLKFLQLRAFIRTSQNSLIAKRLTSSLEKLMSKDILSKDAISELYDVLMSNSSEHSDCKRNLWSKDLGKQISPEDWVQYAQRLAPNQSTLD